MRLSIGRWEFQTKKEAVQRVRSILLPGTTLFGEDREFVQ